MIRIRELKLSVGHDMKAVKKKAAKTLGIKEESIKKLIIRKRSIDSRRKPDILFSYTVDVETDGEEKILKRTRTPGIARAELKTYSFPVHGEKELERPPIIIGFGPAGMFAGLMLARAGFCPVILERGDRVRERIKKVDDFWHGGALDTESNVQFGEGGAGTFSDGKLNTLVKDPKGMQRFIFDTFVKYGADESILWDYKPHVGTDRLWGIVEGIREEICSLGGQVQTRAKVREIIMRGGRAAGVLLEDGREILSPVVIAATGHSSRDFFAMLHGHGIYMEPKPFAVGFRVQHPQSLIDAWQYGIKTDDLPAASYKLTASCGGRGVYSFCMCPGGYVVNASSENGMLAVNGMSYHDRAGSAANSAIVVQVGVGDFGGTDVLAGLRFQRELEKKAFAAAAGKIPVQFLGDFLEKKPGTVSGSYSPQVRGEWEFANLCGILPEKAENAFAEAMQSFGRTIKGFDSPDALLFGVESRTSSPVRLARNEGCEASLPGLYPCGEGAGYAGGITSAAMDGMRTAEKIVERYAPKRRM